MSVSVAAERTGGPPHGRHRAGPLELAGLRRRYGRTVALDGLSFIIEPGRIFGFLGPNGAGKTTAPRIVMGIELPDEGAVCWGGRLLMHTDRLAFGYMPEQRGLYPKNLPSPVIDADQPGGVLAVKDQTDSTQITKFCALRLRITKKPPAARSGGSARGYQRDLCDFDRPADPRGSARHVAARRAYLCIAVVHEECSLMPHTARQVVRHEAVSRSGCRSTGSLMVDRW